MIRGLFETHINVRDLERSMRFYEEILGLQLGTKEESRRVALYWMGGWGKTMLGLWEKPPKEIQRQHFAFEVALDDLPAAIADLKEKDVKTMDFFGRPADIPLVFGWMPAASIYFEDPDGHSLEYLAMIETDPRPDLGILTLEDWNLRRSAPAS